MTSRNIFSQIPKEIPAEIIENLLETAAFSLERIISKGYATPPDNWYDQKTDEWVLLLQGSAGLLIEGQKQITELRPGDYILLPAHVRHRVEWTDPETETIWLALHFHAEKKK